MMDQIVSTLTGAPPVEARDNKGRGDKATPEKGGFGDTLSSVKHTSSTANQDASQEEPIIETDAEGQSDASADVVDQLAKQRRVNLQANSALGLNAQKMPSAKDAAPKGEHLMPFSLRASARVKGEEAAAILKKAVGVDERLNLKGAAQSISKDQVILDPDASAADIVSALMIGAEAAATASGPIQNDKASKVDPRSDERALEKLQKRGVDGLAGIEPDEAMKTIGEEHSVPGVDSEATYRFNSVKSSGLRSLDMSVRGNDGRLDFEVKDNGGRITENVTVLDSRRFLGLATPTNATSIAGLIASDSDWASAMRPESALLNAAAQSSTGKVVNTLKLHLTPIELGSVTMSLRMVGDELAVHMTVENNNAYRRLQEDNRSMVEALKAHGITVDQITISVSAADKGDQTQGQSQQGQSGNNQQFATGDSGNGGTGSRAKQAQADNAGGRDGLGGEIDHGTDVNDGGVYL